MVPISVTNEVLVHSVRHGRIPRYDGSNLPAKVRDGLLVLSWAYPCTNLCGKDIDDSCAIVLQVQASVIGIFIDQI